MRRHVQTDDPQLHEHILLPHRRTFRWPAAHVRNRRNHVTSHGSLLPHPAHGRERYQAPLCLRWRASQAQVRRARKAIPAQVRGSRCGRRSKGDWHGRRCGEVLAADSQGHEGTQRGVPKAAEADGYPIHRCADRGRGTMRDTGARRQGVCGRE